MPPDEKKTGADELPAKAAPPPPQTSDEEDVSYSVEEHDAFMKERELLLERQKEVSARLITAKTTIAGGALALSLTFVEKLAPQGQPSGNTWMVLVLAWICLAMSLFSTPLGLLISLYGHSQEIDLEAARLQEQTDEFATLQQKTNRNRTWIAGLNVGSIVLLFIGLASMLAFAGANLRSRANAPMTPPQIATPSRAGATPTDAGTTRADAPEPKETRDAGSLDASSLPPPHRPPPRPK